MQLKTVSQCICLAHVLLYTNDRPKEMTCLFPASLKKLSIICCRFNKVANMEIYDFCENMIRGLIAGVQSHCENKEMISYR